MNECSKSSKRSSFGVVQIEVVGINTRDHNINNSRSMHVGYVYFLQNERGVETIRLESTQTELSELGYRRMNERRDEKKRE